MDSWSTSDSSDSDSSREEGPRLKIKKIEEFVDQIVPHYSNKTFESHFRISRKTVEMLLDRLDSSHVIPIHDYGVKKISSEKSMLLTLWYLSNNETFRQISDRFCVSLSSAHCVLTRVLNFLLTLKSEYIVKKGQFDNVIGVIDCCHIRIKKPIEQGDNYVNRKGFLSIILQAICDADKMLTDVFCGERGSLHDARVLQRSNLYAMAKNPNYFENYSLLGDSAYPRLPWLVTPYKDTGTLTQEQKQFNFNHSSVRISIEHSFRLMKSTFRRLLYINNYDIKLCVKIVMASCILHNLCIKEKDNTNIEILSIEEDSV
ncbi:hypothetical protein RN001_003573 [Aquatica leii]|uniref:DDE Tnp4 domain-containing protein n=1 Tax=Aquatica leii TaxID=1421715 RepID=A0AAN7Q9N9_9COLE|nr:hypothetical protein RN001_003573 [Aquatica leii]